MTGHPFDALRDSEGHPDPVAIVGEFWHRDGPHSPASVATAAEGVDELVHYLARATRHVSTLPHGPDVYRIIGELRSALGRLDQVLGQVGRHAASLADDATLYDDRRDRPADGTAREVHFELGAAAALLADAWGPFDRAHSAAAHLGHDITLDDPDVEDD